MHPAPLTTDQETRLARFAQLVRQSPHNLVSRRAREELETRHVPEAVALARLLPATAHRLLDVGSGGGFPGLVIAIVRRDLDVGLLEATAKKAAFLEEAAAELAIEVTVHHGRAEELARSPMREAFGTVTARAVAPLVDLVPLALPFLAQDGVLYAVKGERWAQELEAASGALRRTGGVVLATPDDLPQASPGDPDVPAPRVVMIGRAR